MAWFDRLKTAAFTSPSGTRIEFLYENVAREGNKKGAEFIFPERTGAYIQDQGEAGRRYPMTVFFAGEDYDTEADAFFEALGEKGVGRLEHPRYGTLAVVVTGSFTQRDDLVTEANQAAFDIVFSETIEDLTFPESTTTQESILKSAVNDFEAESAAQFASDITIETAAELTDVQNELTNQVATIDSALAPVAATDSNANTAYQTVKAELDNNIANIDSDADTIATQSIILQRIPGTIASKFATKLDAYAEIVQTVASTAYLPSLTSAIPRNRFFSAMLTSYTAISALCESAINSLFSTRPEAADAANSILELYDYLKDWQDSNINSLDTIDVGGMYDSMTGVVSSAVAYLVGLSFDLPDERIIVLGEDRQMVELVAELYGDLDQLDFFIQTNDLNADEMELIPRGREVVYYE